MEQVSQFFRLAFKLCRIREAVWLCG